MHFFCIYSSYLNGIQSTQCDTFDTSIRNTKEKAPTKKRVKKPKEKEEETNSLTLTNR